MANKIVPHRDTFLLPDSIQRGGIDDYQIDGVFMFSAQLAHDNNWWVIPALCSDDDIASDFGPFDTFDQAQVFLMLRGNLVTC